MPIVLSIILYVISLGMLSWAVYRNLKDAKRAKSLRAQIETIKEDAKLQLDSLNELHIDEFKRLEKVNNSDLWRVNECRRQCEAERREALDKINTLSERLSSSSPQQVSVCHVTQEGLQDHIELLNLGTKVGQLFRPLQLETFQLAKDMRIFLNEIGPQPTIQKEDYPKTYDGIWQSMKDRNAIEGPWLETLGHAYAARFSAVVSDLVHRIGARGIDVSALEPYSKWVGSEDNVNSVIDALWDLARTLEVRDR